MDISQSLSDAFATFKEGKLSDAADMLSGILEKDGQNADALHLLGIVRYRQKDMEEAYRLVSGAIRENPNIFFYHNNLAMILRDRGNLNEALDAAAAAVALAPNDSDALTTKEMILQHLERNDEAAHLYRSAIVLKPNHFQAHLNLALLALAVGDLDTAEVHFQRARLVSPNTSDALIGLGKVFIKRREFTKAKSLLCEALAQRLHNTNIYLLLAETYLRTNEPEQAHSILLEARRHHPENALIWNDLGYALRDLVKLEEARFAFERALSIDHGFDDAADNLAQVLLAQGEFGKAWPYYARRKSAYSSHSSFDGSSFRDWIVADTDGRELVTWTEQGLGDEILQASLIPDLSQRVAKLTVLCSDRLAKLFQHSFPKVDVIARGSIDLGMITPGQVQRIPLIDTASGLRTAVEHFPRRTAYLSTPSEDVSAIRHTYIDSYSDPQKPPVLIGISWQSSHALYGNANSIPLEHWGPIFKAAASMERSVLIVAIQHGVTANEVEQLSKSLGVPILFDPAIDQTGDLADIAVQISAMDLVISTSTTTVQLAGALGRPTWHMPAAGLACRWYWLADGDRTPWYPSMRLFRRNRHESSAEQIEKVAKALTELTS